MIFLSLRPLSTSDLLSSLLSLMSAPGDSSSLSSLTTSIVFLRDNLGVDLVVKEGGISEVV